MKLWEAIREIEKDRRKVFESDVEGYTVLKATNSGVSLRFEDVTHNENSALISLNRDWHEVKKPVPWQEAIEAWANHKRVRCEIDGHVWTYDWNVAEKSEMVAIEDGFGISPLEIKNGKWFIEEEKING